ncbi:MAG: diguanylate cyclase/phosphodiesterase (GGDEF & EAL domains) with PAS/PAC sensor(s) [uncultured Gemmatimonadetes bacterium]|uniref:Diguanylate cyclase/phosphodiesterase (GGDEF & EAL domains) with PAS/PAC sensor(S) n=1 Tax=uncultured Gemmatimonadota bacterium TaxID=203437 RepID=A0A6J4MN18_9BACT|nr:MAG: diguanylate cyclase/phosphodiesterase (GGDEF & EAL domains) with PAS/PAC sensor(s) [uncultured Gemmatimonadota bacterium]
MSTPTSQARGIVQFLVTPIDGLLDGVVHRLGASAAGFVAGVPDAELHGDTGAPDQARLAGVLDDLRPYIQEVLDSGEARYLSLASPEAAVALVPVPCGGDEPLGCLAALSRRGWSAPERVALECMADAAAARISRSRAEHRVRMLEGALRAAELGVTIADERGRIVYANPAEARMHGYEVEDLYGREARSLAPPELWSPSAGVPRRAGRWARERTNVRSDGTRFPVRLCSDAIVDDEAGPLGLVTWCEDLTGAGRDAPEVPATDRDALTGVLDRAAFMRRLQLACAARVEPRSAEFALLFVDLDRFKAVNDRHGHAAGDALLGTVGRRLAACVRPTDTVGRVGGDEFAVLVHGARREADAVPVAQRIQRTLSAAAPVGALEVHPSASIGIALSSECESAEELLACADLAMYRAKALGPGHYGSADAALRTHDSAVGALEDDLRRAIDADELALRFQPIVSLEHGGLVGFEALVRWDHPERGLLGPQAFLPVAERSELIVDIDRWVLRAAARQLREWTRRYPAPCCPSVSVNFSGRHVVRPDVVEHTRDVLREFGLEPGQLTVEVTETSMVDDAEAAATTLTRLREHGVRLALDDFGTGYSSLAYLRQLPFDVLKIDRSFVQRVGHASPDRAIVRSVVALAHTLGLSVTAEGVETREQESSLRSFGCEHAQGFLFAQPVTAAVAAGWIERR